MLRVAAVSATFLGAVSAQDAPRGPPGKIEGYTSYSQRACAWSQYEEGSDWKFGATTSDDSAACAALCEAADDCTGFEVGPATSSNYATSGGYCALWFNKACSAESDMLTLSQSAYLATTYVRDAPAAAATTTAAAETPGVGNDAPTTTAVVATTAGEGLYVLKYPQQACEWAYYTEGEDWAMYLDGSNDPSTCAAGCLATEGCTGFEVGSNAGGVYAAGPYCALWFNGACAVPDESFSGAFGAFIGGSVDVDTYTLTEPVDAFKDFENRACAWSYYQEGADWAFADKTSEDPEACAKLCLDSPDGCTGFEVGVSSASTEFGDLSQGYCALWFNNSCAPDEFLEQYTGASTYVLIDGSGCDHSSSHMYYFMLMATGLMLCLLGCCCCRRAAMRRRLAMRRAAAAAANAAVAVRAPAGTAAVAAVAVEGRGHRGTRAVVYAVQVGAEQEEPEKV